MRRWRKKSLSFPSWHLKARSPFTGRSLKTSPKWPKSKGLQNCELQRKSLSRRRCIIWLCTLQFLVLLPMRHQTWKLSYGYTHLRGVQTRNQRQEGVERQTGRRQDVRINGKRWSTEKMPQPLVLNPYPAHWGLCAHDMQTVQDWVLLQMWWQIPRPR